jgi:hypothetical protein
MDWYIGWELMNHSVLQVKHQQKHWISWRQLPVVKFQNLVADPAFILNMDQTPIPFTYNSKTTLELIGCRTVHVRKSTNDTKRATFAMTVTASGHVLTPLIVFKGKPGGRIALA